jgi:hypothetical protein
MSIQIFITLSAISVKIWMKNWNLLGQSYSFYRYIQDFSYYFHDFEKKFVSSVLNLPIYFPPITIFFILDKQNIQEIF